MTVTQTVGLGARDHANLSEVEAYLSGIGTIAEDYRFDFYDDGEIFEAANITFGNYGQTAVNTITLQPAGMDANGTNISTEGFDAKADFSTEALDYNGTTGKGAAVRFNNTINLTVSAYFIIQGLQFNFNAGTITPAGTSIIFRRCILRGEWGQLFALNSAGDNLLIENCFLPNNKNAQTHNSVFSNQSGVKLINSTLVNSHAVNAGIGVYIDNGDVETTQCLVLTNASNPLLFAEGAGGVGTGYYCVLNSTSHDWLGTGSIDSATLANELENGTVSNFTDPVDGRLKTGATSIGFIPDASRDANTPTVDIRGQTRVGIDVDCGCFQTAAAEPPPTGKQDIYLGSQQLDKIYLGGTEVAKAYLGATLIWDPAGAPAGPDMDLDFRLNWGADVNEAINNGPSSLTFSRADTVATGFDQNGVLQTATTDQARFDHDPSNNVAKGVLIEGAATNVCLQSEDFDTTWIKGGGITTAQDETAPDGTATAWTLTDANAGDFAFVYQAPTIPGDSSFWCFSCFVKKDSDETRFPGFGMRVDGTTIWALLNTATGAVGAITGQVFDDIGVIDAGAWWRVYAIKQGSTATNGRIEIYPALTTTWNGSTEAAAQGSIVAWGAQLENTAYPTSYVSTTTSSVTRADERLYTTDVSWLDYVNKPISIFWQEDTYDTEDASNYSFSFSDGAANIIYNRTRLLDRPRFEYISQGTNLRLDTGGLSSPQSRALSINELDTKSSSWGATTESAAAPNLRDSSILTQLDIGCTRVGQSLMGHIPIMRVWNEAKTQEELNTITSDVPHYPTHLSATVT